MVFKQPQGTMRCDPQADFGAYGGGTLAEMLLFSKRIHPLVTQIKSK
jgi:hypothetical protein